MGQIITIFSHHLIKNEDGIEKVQKFTVIIQYNLVYIKNAKFLMLPRLNYSSYLLEKDFFVVSGYFAW